MSFTLPSRPIHLLLTSLLALLLASPGVNASSLDSVPETYPGLIAGAGRAVFHIEPAIVKIGVQVFHACFGEWPRTWSEVREAGIVTSQLRTPWGATIDPDDRRLDMDFDFHYDYHNAAPRLAFFSSLSAPAVTYSLIEEFPPLIPSAVERYPGLPSKVGSPERRLQLAVFRATHQCIQLFAMVKGRAPRSWQEFADSGFCPIAPGTLNPLTGAPYQFDGSPDNFNFEAKPELSPMGGYRFEPMDESGKAFWPFSL